MNNKIMSRLPMASALLAFALVSGCATAPATTYNWGTYQNQLYARFKSSTTPAQQIQEMEKTLKAGKSNRPVAPGFHAHLGLLYGEVGRAGEMREQFLIEKEMYPESSAFMDFLLTKADKSKGSK